LCAELRKPKEKGEVVPSVPLFGDSAEVPSGGLGTSTEERPTRKRLRSSEKSDAKKAAARSSPGSSLRVRKVREFRDRVAAMSGVRKVKFVDFLQKYKSGGAPIVILRKLRESWDRQSETNAEKKAECLLEYAAELLSDEEYPVLCMERLLDRFDEEFPLDIVD
jgi:hypothetical protein